LEQGTGAVHTAPGHGHEDYSVGKAYGLDIYCPVDGQGRFEKDTEFFAGMNVFEANPKVVELLESNGSLLATETIIHPYPHCWRCHNPVIFRATPQWFISMEHQNLRRRSLEAITQVHWIPDWGEERISNMIANRPDWCISRQRVWGVPIIVFYCRQCKEPMLEKAALDHVVSLFERHGSDVWFEQGESELLPAGIQCSACGAKSFQKESDILDVWFDSGSSQQAVLGKRWDVPWPADVYIEGGDQYRGWFHSSLLIGVAVHQGAPYREVLTHGWTLDAEGKAMSKSLGNVIEPQLIVKESGAEILRLWVAASDFKEDVRISKDMVIRLSEAYRKFRNTARFMLGNLFDFDPETDSVETNKLSDIDQWALLQTRELLVKIYGWYENYEFHRVYHAINEFVTVDLSAFYFHILKDRLYTAAPSSAVRRSSQTAIHRILNAITRAMAPIYTFTCDEIWQHLPKGAGSEESVHISTFVPADQLIDGLSSETLQKLSQWNHLRELRASILKVLEVARKDKFIGDPLEAKVLLEAKGAAKQILSEYFEFLPYLLVVSQVELLDRLEPQKYFAEEGELRIAVVPAEGAKCERCWNYSTKVGKDSTFPGVCDRCAAALREMGY
jgi:isoleucyl-tRNA synthetase